MVDYSICLAIMFSDPLAHIFRSPSSFFAAVRVYVCGFVFLASSVMR